MERLIKKIEPIKEVSAFQGAYDDWRINAGLIGETKFDVLRGLNREVVELHEALNTKDSIDTAGEVADVFMLGMTMLEIHGLKLEKLNLIEGRQANTFAELQEEAKRQLKPNGIHTPFDNIEVLLKDIEELKSAIDLGEDVSIDISARMLMHSVMIIEQLGFSIENVLMAKYARNNIKYEPKKLNELQAQGLTIQAALAIARENWNSESDREIFMDYLDIN